MTQILVTLEDGWNPNIIRSAINLIKGVKNAVVTHADQKSESVRVEERLHAFDKLAGSLSLANIDLSDERTRYLLGK